MINENRIYGRIEKPLTLQFSLSEMSPKKWDISVIQNISAGGIKFSAPSDLEVKDKIIYLKIKIPELAPHLLELEATVLDSKPRMNTRYSDVRAKFINLSEENKEHLTIVKKMIEKQSNKKS